MRMSGRAKVLSWQARELGPSDRIALVADILDSLDAAEPQVDRLWIVEAKERVTAYRRGDDLTVGDLDEFLAKRRL